MSKSAGSSSGPIYLTYLRIYNYIDINECKYKDLDSPQAGCEPVPVAAGEQAGEPPAVAARALPGGAGGRHQAGAGPGDL